MELDQIKKIVDELDRGISRENAAVRIDTCDPNDLFVTATRNGYLRIGVEFLKAAFAEIQPADEGESKSVQVDTEYLVTADSATNFSWFERVENIEDKPDESDGSWILYPVLAMLIAVPILAIVGLVAIIRSIFF